ncbi:phage tail assembly protein [Celerinatantimonas sp. YJH-8]|uniref:phage tail assembly protein n=1 Tax=Celerinatantimonas sp. YJH-8 TaxID=3228714 RepID=UPI0038C45A29
MSYPNEKTAVELEFPVFVAGVEYKTLSFRRPKVRDNLIADKTNPADADKEIHLMALLGEVERAVIEELDMSDYTQVQQVIMGFQKKAQDLPSEPSSAD